MTLKPRNLLAGFFISIFLSSPVLADDFMDGWIALEKEEYAKALKLLGRLAKDGHTQSQYFVGMMYDKGYGVTENDKTAIKWYCKAVKSDNHVDAVNRLKEMKVSCEDVTESSCPSKTYSLTVNATPSSNRIMIMNIRPKYKSGICLEPGKYDILVKHWGYYNYRKWITIEDSDVSLDVTLMRK